MLTLMPPSVEGGKRTSKPDLAKQGNLEKFYRTVHEEA